MKRSHLKQFAITVRSIHLRKRFSRTVRILGPGVTTGAADDDPSGIATYSQAGAMQGYSMLWALPAMFPLLLAVQDTCARIGAVTGKGLAAVIKEHYSRKMLTAAVLLVVVANVVNIGADIGAMVAALQLLIPLPFVVAAVSFVVVIVFMQITIPYHRYAKVLKWLSLFLFAYLLTAFIISPDWGKALYETVTPNITFNEATMYLLVGLLGTTISPYLFFWDTSEVVEGEIETKRLGIKGLHPPKITAHFLRSVRIDTIVGMVLASATAWFIMLVCAVVLNAHGITEINTAADAAKALEPLVQGFPYAGFVAKFIFAIGIIGLGMLAIPALAGSSAYALSESFNWREGLYRKFKKASAFYITIAIATVAGLSINFIGINPIQALIFAAVFNGISAVPLLAMIALVGRNADIMGDYRISKLASFGIWTAFVVMLLAAVAMMASIIAN